MCRWLKSEETRQRVMSKSLAVEHVEKSKGNECSSCKSLKLRIEDDHEEVLSEAMIREIVCTTQNHPRQALITYADEHVTTRKECSAFCTNAVYARCLSVLRTKR